MIVRDKLPAQKYGDDPSWIPALPTYGKRDKQSKQGRTREPHGRVWQRTCQMYPTFCIDGVAKFGPLARPLFRLLEHCGRISNMQCTGSCRSVGVNDMHISATSVQDEISGRIVDYELDSSSWFRYRNLGRCEHTYPSSSEPNTSSLEL